MPSHKIKFTDHLVVSFVNFQKTIFRHGFLKYTKPRQRIPRIGRLVSSNSHIVERKLPLYLKIFYCSLKFKMFLSCAALTKHTSRKSCCQGQDDISLLGRPCSQFFNLFHENYFNQYADCYFSSQVKNYVNDIN